MPSQVDFFTGKDKDAYWRVTDSDGNEVNRSSEGFRHLGSAKNNLLIFHTLLSTDLIAFFNDKPLASLEFFNDDQGGHRWHVKSTNGEIVGASHKGFPNFGEAKNNVLMTYSLISTYIASMALEK